MPLPSSGNLSFLDIGPNFGYNDFSYVNDGGTYAPSWPKTNISLSSYYRGGTRVPNITQNNSIPTSGPISMSNFYGSTGKYAYGAATNNMGQSGTLYGIKDWGTPTFGGALDYLVSYNVFNYANLYWDSSSKIMTFSIGYPGEAVLPNTDLTFYSVSIPGKNEYVRSAASYSAATLTTPNLWTWSEPGPNWYDVFGNSGFFPFLYKVYS